jgi:NADP-dependent 3-hydroxy acid dehydrogenase YdfG
MTTPAAVASADVARPRSIFITGAGKGIGAATARLFAANGWQVGACEPELARLETLHADLGPQRFTPYAADVRDPDALVQAMGAFAARQGGRLDAVFANAGILFMGRDDTLTPEQKNSLVDVNVKGVLHTMHAALPYLKATPGAHAVAMCSTSAEYGSPEHAVYSATKFFVRGYTEALNIEYAPLGINVSGIYVAYVDTPMVREATYKPASIDRLGVKATADDVARTVWRAVHGRRAHWRVGFDASMTHYAARLLGGALAPIYARLMR